MGDPILVVVEEEGDVASFADFIVDTAPAVEAEPTPEPPVTPPAPTFEPVAAVAPVKSVAPAAPTPVVAVEEPAAAPAVPSGTMAPVWGNKARTTSPIAKIMSASQKKYVKTYGTTGQSPL